jgi:parvulin-like peptidyl-prolyl isomerase
VYKQVISDYYDWTFDEYKASVQREMLSKKVNAALDTESRATANRVVQQIGTGVDFADLAKVASEDPLTKAQGGDVGFVSKSSDDPNGLIAAATPLQAGQISGVIEGSDGFYVVKLLEKRDNGDVHFAKIFISYKVVANQLANLKKQGKVNEFIKVSQIANPINQ